MAIQPGTGYTFTSSSLGHNLTIEKPWAPWDGSAASTCALAIMRLWYDDTDEVYYIIVSPGAVNNLGVTDYDDVLLSNTPAPKIEVFTDGIGPDFTTNYIYIACENEGSPTYAFPSTTVPPYILVSPDPLTDTDEIGYVLIGIVKGKTVDDVDTLQVFNYKGCGSLWGDRLKTGTDTARYYYARI
jgi:hypothetical protein